MRSLRAALMLLVFATLQLAFAGKVAVAGISPDLLCCFAVYAALYMRPAGSFAWAWGAGLISDLLFGFKLGPFAIMYCACAYVLAGVRSTPFRGSLVAHSVAAFVCTAVTHLGYWMLRTAFAAISGGAAWRVGLVEALGTSLGVAVYSSVVAPAAIELLAWSVGRGEPEVDIISRIAVRSPSGGGT